MPSEEAMSRTPSMSESRCEMRAQDNSVLSNTATPKSIMKIASKEEWISEGQHRNTIQSLQDISSLAREDENFRKYIDLWCRTFPELKEFFE